MEEKTNQIKDKEILEQHRQYMREYLNLYCTEKESEIVKWHFGLNDDTPKLVEDVVERFGVTREYIRQLERKVFCLLKIRINRTKNLEWLKKFIDEVINKYSDTIDARIIEYTFGLTDGRVKTEEEVASIFEIPEDKVKQVIKEVSELYNKNYGGRSYRKKLKDYFE